MLTLLGGLSGVFLGAAGCAGIGAALGWSVSVPLEALALAPAISIAVGIFFGFYRRAGRPPGPDRGAPPRIGSLQRSAAIGSIRVRGGGQPAGEERRREEH